MKVVSFAEKCQTSLASLSGWSYCNVIMDRETFYYKSCRKYKLFKKSEILSNIAFNALICGGELQFERLCNKLDCKGNCTF